MRLKQYILNENRGKKIKESKALDLLKTRCSNAWRNAYMHQKIMYRS